MTILHVRLSPKASEDRIDGWGEDDKRRAFLKIRLTAPPIEGRANAALISFMAERLGIPKSRIKIKRGDSSRLKALEIDGLSEAELFEKLGSS